MPACTALGWKSRTSLAVWSGRSSDPREHPAAVAAAARASASSRRERAIGGAALQPPPGLAQPPSPRLGPAPAAAAGRRTGVCRVCRVRRRVTFSRNVTLSLSRTCQCFCKYCAFATHRPHLHAPEEVTALLDDAARRRVKELLVLTGEAPDHHPGVRERLTEWGFEDFTAYVVWACQQGLERGLLPHTNLGVLSAADLGRLREVTASQGLMLESVNADLVAHQGSPTKHPERRLATIRAAGELRIPFTSGILVGIGEFEEDRMASLEALAGHDHIQEIILQNFVPHRRYYGEEPAEIATDAAERYWATGIGSPPPPPPPPAPEGHRPAWANE